MTKYEKIQAHLLRLPPSDCFGKILESAGFRCVKQDRVFCDPELDCRNCRIEKTNAPTANQGEL